MSRADVEQFLAQAEDVLTDWDGSPDAATWNPQVEQDDSDPGPLDYYLQDRPNTFWAGPPRHRMTGEDVLAVARAFDVPPEILAMRPIGHVRDRSEQPPPAMTPLRLQQMPQAQVNLYTMTAEQCRDAAMDYIRTHYRLPQDTYRYWLERQVHWTDVEEFPLPLCPVHGCQYELHIDQRNGEEPGRCEVYVRTRVVCPAGHDAEGLSYTTFDGASCVSASNEVDSVVCATADGTTPNPTDCGSEAADGGTT